MLLRIVSRIKCHRTSVAFFDIQVRTYRSFVKNRSKTACFWAMRILPWPSMQWYALSSHPLWMPCPCWSISSLQDCCFLYDLPSCKRTRNARPVGAKPPVFLTLWERNPYKPLVFIVPPVLFGKDRWFFTHLSTLLQGYPQVFPQ